MAPSRLVIGLLERLSPRRSWRSPPPLRDGGIAEAAMMTDALRLRELSGQRTTLRHLHIILDIPQPTALRIAYLLEREGVVTIKEDLSDRLESELRLTNEIRERLHSVRGEDSSQLQS